MANESTKIELYGHNSAGDVMPFTISSSVAIPKGSLMVLSASPRTMSIHSGAGNEVFVGVASAEKDASDTSTQLGVFTNGVFEMAASGSINDGNLVALADKQNYVIASTALTDTSKLVGIALSDASGGVVPVRILK